LESLADPHAGGIPAAAVVDGAAMQTLLLRLKARTEAREAQSAFPPRAADLRPDNFMMKLFTRCSSQRRFYCRNVEVPPL